MQIKRRSAEPKEIVFMRGAVRAPCKYFLGLEVTGRPGHTLIVAASGEKANAVAVREQHFVPSFVQTGR